MPRYTATRIALAVLLCGGASLLAQEPQLEIPNPETVHSPELATPEPDRPRPEEYYLALRQLAAANRRLVELGGAEGLRAQIEATRLEREKTEARLAEIEREYERAKERVHELGLSRAVGYFLRRRLSELPDLRRLARRIREGRQELGELQLKQVEYNEERADLLREMEGETQRLLREVTVAPGTEEAAEVERVARTLQSQRLDLLQSVLDTFDELFTELFGLDAARSKLAQRSEEYSDYIRERILWTPSGAPLSIETFRDAGPALQWLFEAPNWRNAVQLGLEGAQETSGLYLAMLTVLVLVGIPRSRWRRKLKEAGSEAARPGAHHFRPTLKALLYSTLLSLFWPGLLATGAAFFDAPDFPTAFASAISAGLIGAARTLLFIRFAAWIFCGEGLAVNHFGWSPRIARAVWRQAQWLTLTFVPLVFLVTTYYDQSDIDFSESIGRLALILIMALSTFAIYRLLRRRSALIAEGDSGEQPGSFGRFRPLWYPVALFLPIALGTATVLGYTYASFGLVRLLLQTTALFLLLGLVYALFARWLLVERRKMMLNEMTRKREEAAAADPSRAAPEMAELPEMAVDTIDLAAVNRQSLRLARRVLSLVFLFGLAGLWSYLLPALQFAGRTSLWSIDTAVGPQNITVQSIFVALLWLFFMLVAIQDVPALLELTILRRIHAGSGVRFAVTTLVRYGITVAGVVAAFGALGIAWEKVQWLVAALSVGLGFGLQEIFANFVSGVVILVERPIRLGDVVTVGQISGQVTRIQLRATTIADFDRKELIVPNRQFVTSELINWTLTDPVVRYRMAVGVAYGSDTEKTQDLLLKVAKENPTVLHDPCPRVVFSEFGDSALTFELYIYLPHRDFYLETIHALHMAVDHAFREAGIVIAFPQRDVHFDASRPVEVRVVSGPDTGKTAVIPDRP